MLCPTGARAWCELQECAVTPTPSLQVLGMWCSVFVECRAVLGLSLPSWKCQSGSQTLLSQCPHSPGGPAVSQRAQLSCSQASLWDAADLDVC